MLIAAEMNLLLPVIGTLPHANMFSADSAFGLFGEKGEAGPI